MSIFPMHGTILLTCKPIVVYFQTRCNTANFAMQHYSTSTVYIDENEEYFNLMLKLNFKRTHYL